MDYYWQKLSEGGDEKAQQCGWLKDKFGLSWQISPAALDEMMKNGTRAQIVQPRQTRTRQCRAGGVERRRGARHEHRRGDVGVFENRHDHQATEGGTDQADGRVTVRGRYATSLDDGSVTALLSRPCPEDSL
mgnify:CR=1 FL=1